MKNSLVLFETQDETVKLDVSLIGGTVWLTRNQMAELFDRDTKTIGKHINNALHEELDLSTVAKFATVQKEGERSIERSIDHYNLDILYFLEKNNMLIRDGRKIIDDYTLVAITIMIAESKPEEKETMVKLVMNFICQPVMV